MLEIKVTYDITYEVSVTYTDADIMRDLNVGTQSEGDLTNVSFGIVSKYGSFSVFDKNDFVRNAIIAGTLSSDSVVFVEVKIDGTVIAYQQASIQYDMEACEIIFEFMDSLNEWANINYPGFTFFSVYDASEKTSGGSIYGGLISGDMHIAMLTGEELYNKLKIFTEGQNEVFETLSTVTLTWLQSIKIYVPFIEPCLLSDAWNDFCTLTLTHLYKGPTGAIRVVHYD